MQFCATKNDKDFLEKWQNSILSRVHSCIFSTDLHKDTGSLVYCTVYTLYSINQWSYIWIETLNGYKMLNQIVYPVKELGL